MTFPVQLDRLPFLATIAQTTMADDTLSVVFVHGFRGDHTSFQCEYHVFIRAVLKLSIFRHSFPNGFTSPFKPNDIQITNIRIPNVQNYTAARGCS
jgi:hypothetical protein